MSAKQIDLGRLAVLRTVTDREKAAAQAASDRMQADMEAVGTLRREVLALQRRVGSREGAVSPEVRTKQVEIARVETRIAAASEQVQILRERSSAAMRLRSRCEEWVNAHGLAGRAH